jgi:CPA2 family monovalent cation:H+ antiporter-2
MVRSTIRHPLGEPVYYGDVSRPELLHRVHASKAAAIVLTMDHADAALHATRAIRREFSEVPLLARAHDEGHAHCLRAAGANLAMPEALEAGLQLTAMVLRAIGMTGERASEAIRGERDTRLSRAERR